MEIYPGGDGYMPLSCALHWIVSAGYQTDFQIELSGNATAQAFWRDASIELAATASADKLPIIGLTGDGRTERLNAICFGNVQWDFWFEHTKAARLSRHEYGDSPRIFVWPFLSEAQWHGDFNDRYILSGAEKWRKLQVERESVRRNWGFNPTKAALVVRDEAAAIKALTMELRSHPELTVEAARSFCGERYQFSKRGFQSRIWPMAREKAGLPTKAPPGRKSRA